MYSWGPPPCLARVLQQCLVLRSASLMLSQSCSVRVCSHRHDQCCSRMCAAAAQAHRFFSQLKELGAKRTGIEDRKLDMHITFCAQTHQAALKHVEQVCPPALQVGGFRVGDLPSWSCTSHSARRRTRPRSSMWSRCRAAPQMVGLRVGGRVHISARAEQVPRGPADAPPACSCASNHSLHQGAFSAQRLPWQAWPCSPSCGDGLSACRQVCQIGRAEKSGGVGA